MNYFNTARLGQVKWSILLLQEVQFELGLLDFWVWNVAHQLQHSKHHMVGHENQVLRYPGKHPQRLHGVLAAQEEGLDDEKHANWIVSLQVGEGML